MGNLSEFKTYLQHPLYTYLQAEQGVSLLEALWLEDLSND